MKLIIDTDPGIDDAMAYFYAHAQSNFDLIALTTVFGNVTVEDATKNALWMTEFSEANTIQVYKGAAFPLEIDPNPVSDFVHGKHGFGDYVIGHVNRSESEEHASDFLVRAAKEAPGEITLCAIGPLTNVALAIQKDPNFISNLKQLVIMGGSLYADGNITPYAEANFWNDPHAADIVVNAPGEGNIVIVGLDVTDRICFKPSDIDDIVVGAPKTGGFLKEILAFYMTFYHSRSGRFECSLHDPAAVIACEMPSLFQMERQAVSVVTEGDKIGALQKRDNISGRECHICVEGQFSDIIEQYKKVVMLNP